MTIDGNGGELPKEVLVGDAGCELRKNQYGTAILTLETKDETNSIDWQFKQAVRVVKERILTITKFNGMGNRNVPICFRQLKPLIMVV